MKATTVDTDGTVRCPVCGATSFTSKRTIKGKLAAGVLAPKRLKCDGCGTDLKRGEPPRRPTSPAPEPWTGTKAEGKALIAEQRRQSRERQAAAKAARKR
jgi:hypothetical protein